MRLRVPDDLPANPAEAYRRGWRDRATVGARIAGKSVSRAKSAAARRNGRKGGRPRHTEQ